MVAGPNGSGKSTLVDYLKTRFQLGVLLNPDELDRALQTDHRLDLAARRTPVDDLVLRGFVHAHPLWPHCEEQQFEVKDNVLLVPPSFKPGYFTSILCDFMRRHWLEVEESFTFETVMSNRDKVDLLADAMHLGFRTYVYYICTDSPVINRERVAARVLGGGHDVPQEKIESRYDRSLKLLFAAIQSASRAYMFDNSGKSHRLVAEFEAGQLIQVSEEPPNWLVAWVLERLP